MKSIPVLFHSRTLEPLGRPAIWITWLDDPLLIKPGQVLLLHPQGCHLLPELCLPLQIRPDGLLLETPAQDRIAIGDRLQIWGPIGKPFNPPENCRQWLLLAPVHHAGRLLPLVEAGLERGVSVALWSTLPVPQLPPAVELLTDPSEGLAWADYIALDLANQDPIDFHQIGLQHLSKLKDPKIEVLRTPPMPCGFGACGLCAVKGKRGWHLACLDGPVFDGNELEL
jgi:hypothetical protein